MGRTPCCDKNNGLKKGPWTPEEDQKLVDYIQKHGYGNWRTLPKNAGLQRCGKSCRLRWTNYLRPDIKRGRFSFEEEETIIQLHSIIGNKWSAIASRLPGRTDNEIKNYWNTHIRKRLLRMGIDPVTHSPRLDLLDLSSVITSSLYGSQMNNNMLAINPELLKLASSLWDQNGGATLLSNTPQLQDHHIPQQQLLLQQANFVELEPNVNVDPYPSNFNHYFGSHDDEVMMSDYYLHATNRIASSSGPYNATQLMPCYDDHNYLMDPETSTYNFQCSNNSNNHNLSGCAFANNNSSVLSTPSSSPKPLNSISSSTYLNGSCSTTEDERESYVVSSSSNITRFQIPDLLDLNDFMYVM